MDNYESTCNIFKIIKNIFYIFKDDVADKSHIMKPTSPAPYKRDKSLVQRGLPYRK